MRNSGLARSEIIRSCQATRRGIGKAAERSLQEQQKYRCLVEETELDEECEEIEQTFAAIDESSSSSSSSASKKKSKKDKKVKKEKTSSKDNKKEKKKKDKREKPPKELSVHYVQRHLEVCFFMCCKYFLLPSLLKLWMQTPPPTPHPYACVRDRAGFRLLASPTPVFGIGWVFVCCARMVGVGWFFVAGGGCVRCLTLPGRAGGCVSAPTSLPLGQGCVRCPTSSGFAGRCVLAPTSHPPTPTLVFGIGRVFVCWPPPHLCSGSAGISFVVPGWLGLVGSPLRGGVRALSHVAWPCWRVRVGTHVPAFGAGGAACWHPRPTPTHTLNISYPILYIK